MLEPERKDRFLNLARGGSFLREEQVLGQLLGQRRAALLNAARGQVADQRPCDPDGIDAVMGCRSGGPRWR